MLTFDAHLDLALNALQLNRDLQSSVYTIRAQELGIPGKGRAMGTVALPEMRAGRVALSYVTVVARASGSPSPHIDYPSETQTHGVARGQLAYYRALETEGELRLLTRRADLDALWTAWSRWDEDGVGPPPPLGMVLTMECADAVLDPEDLERWWNDGLRLLGPAHFGPGRYCGGTGSLFGLTEGGPALLAEMDRLGIALDLTHTSDASFWASLERFGGPVLASHSNSRVLVENARQLTDDMIRAIVERDGVIGATLGNWQLDQNWRVGHENPVTVSLERYVDHIEHVCELAGGTAHVGIGSDLDGGTGSDEFPLELDTIVDLQRIPDLLARRGFGDDDVRAFMHGNWLRFTRRILDP
jgi:membrane dipeptidase